MKPICVNCQRFYRPKRNGTFFTEMMPAARHAEPGSQHPEQWKPYKIWMGDLWKCYGCGHKIIVGVGHNPISEHYKPDFQELLFTTEALKTTVNDC